MWPIFSICLVFYFLFCSAPTKAFLSDDRLVNAANSSVRSYMTIARPSAYPVPSLRPTRPNSSGKIMFKYHLVAFEAKLHQGR